MSHEKILIVEDERLVVRDIQLRLERFGYEVVGSTRLGEDAVNMAEQLTPNLVLMDIRLDGQMDGIEAANEIRTRFNLPVVFLTAYADEDTLQRARISEPFGYILKPFDERELRTVIEMALYKHQAESKLRLSERRYAITLSSIGDGVIATNKNGEITFMNPVASALTGWDGDEVLGLPLTKVFYIINEVTRKTVESPVAKVLRSGKITGLANRTVLLAKDGREIPIDDCGAPIIDDNNEITGAVLVFHDVTRQRRADEKLRASEERFRSVFETALIGMAIADLNGNLLQVNQSYEKMLGYTSEELRKLSIIFLTHPDDRAKSIEIVKQLSIGQFESSHLEKRYIRKDGTAISVEITNSVIKNAEGKPQFLAIMAIDITDKKQAEEKYRSIFDNAIEGIFQNTREGKFLTANPAMARILGYESPEELMSTIDDITGQLYVEPERRQDYISQLEENGLVQGFECKFYRKDGSAAWVSLSTRAVRDDDDRVLFYEGMLEEISYRKQLEEQFLQSQKMEAVGRLAGGIAHDFNNMLMPIIGYSEMMLMKLHGDDPLRKPIEIIKKGAERAAALTKQILAFSRKQVLRLHVLDLNAEITDVNRMLHRLIGEDIELVTKLEPSLWSVKADPNQIEQVMLNLAVNARDAMPNGGTLVIETANVELDEEYAKFHTAVEPGEYVMLAVTDTGSGIDAVTQANIFEPFFSTKEMGKGTGLGLSTVYGIIKQSGGNIWVYSEIGHGTTFKIYLPRVKEKAEAITPVAVYDDLLYGKETILIVEDEDGVRQVLRDILESKGYKVLVSSNGNKALEICSKYEGTIQLLITDVVLPSIGGKEVAERILSLYGDIKILYISGYTENAITYNGILDSNTHFLQKPFSSKTLLTKVKEILQKV